MAGIMNHNFMVIIMIFLSVLNIQGINGDLRRLEPPTNGDGSLRVLVIGDWGRKGLFNQSEVAKQMGIIAEKMNIDFIISTGDNFYEDGLTDENDPAFDQSFSDIYTAPSLQNINWYTVLGNHDYRGDALAQLSPVLLQKDRRWFCMKSYVLDTDVANFFLIDTTPFQDSYFTDPEDHVYDWTGVLPREKYLATLLHDLKSSLSESHAKWKIVVGHHTIRSAGPHGNTLELVRDLVPILEENGVDLYINGHDHCLQHISSSNGRLQYLTSGGGSKSWGGVYNWSNSEDQMKFFYDGQGFMTMQVTQTELIIDFYDIFGKILYNWSASKSSSSKFYF